LKKINLRAEAARLASFLGLCALFGCSKLKGPVPKMVIGNRNAVLFRTLR